MSENCVAFVCNKKYLGKLRITLDQLRGAGRYREDVVLIVGPDLAQETGRLSRFPWNVIPLVLPEVDRSEAMKQLAGRQIGDGREYTKTFQWHKLNCFHPALKRWKKILYLDVGMNIYHPVDPLFALDLQNRLWAHSDAYPDYGRTLESQFNGKIFPDLHADLKTLGNLEGDYFQSTMMLYPSSLIQEDTYDRLLELSGKYIHSVTNEQAIMNVYFHLIRNIWTPLPTESTPNSRGLRLYDFRERDGRPVTDYILLKYPAQPPGLPTRLFRKIRKALVELSFR